MKRLIVTADDVGLHTGMTAGALRAHDDGIVTAVSVAANGAAFAEAVPRLLARPQLDVGAHLVLTGERPLSPPAEVRSLVGADGTFLPGFRSVALRYATGGLHSAEVELEWRRQLARLLAAGLRPVHVNSHQHLHLLPRFFEIVVRLAAEFGIPFVRLPRDPSVRWRSTTRGAEIRVLNALGNRARTRLPRDAPSLAICRTLGVVDAGRLTLRRLQGWLTDAPGVCELVCHPGSNQAELARHYSWGYHWEAETAALCDPLARAACRTAGVELTTFSRLSDRPEKIGDRL